VVVLILLIVMDFMYRLTSIVIGFLAGFIGSMLGVGGGFFIVPMIVYFLGVSMHLAVSVSLMCVIMTSLSATKVYSSKGLVDFKLGLLLEIFTSLGAITGSYIALGVEEYILKIVFGLVLSYAALRMILSRTVRERKVKLSKKKIALGSLGSYFAGVASGMLGIGGGTLKVPVMVLLMGVPIRTAIATSSFMIGVTASSAAIVYLSSGVFDLVIAGFIIVGIFVGAQIGSRIGLGVRGIWLRRGFGVLLLVFALKMLFDGLSVIL